jgi:cation transport regulator ChaC
MQRELLRALLYSITKSGLEGLDMNEGYPRHYDRRELGVNLEDGSRVNALVYIAQPYMVEEGLKPSKKYLARYLKGKDILSPQYYQRLKNTPTVD